MEKAVDPAGCVLELFFLCYFGFTAASNIQFLDVDSKVQWMQTIKCCHDLCGTLIIPGVHAPSTEVSGFGLGQSDIGQVEKYKEYCVKQQEQTRTFDLLQKYARQFTTMHHTPVTT